MFKCYAGNVFKYFPDAVFCFVLFKVMMDINNVTCEQGTKKSKLKEEEVGLK